VRGTRPGDEVHHGRKGDVVEVDGLHASASWTPHGLAS
jgi:hypothetical protein